ncbi:MAG: VTT domain-containing protein [Candidatus Peribacteraceae bacterium]|jgi:membrane-associated protein
MAILSHVLEFFLHLDVHLGAIIVRFGVFTYGLLFGVIFCETGLVVTPFLPGDSLLFAAGAFAARGDLSIGLLYPLLLLAAIGGDSTNYLIGAYVGPHVFLRWHLLKQEHLDRAHAFFERHGRKALILSRFLPILRTVAPFSAGIARMTYLRFLSNSVIGGFLWVTLFTWGGYFFGAMPFVEHNFTLVILMIIAISVMPMVIEFLRHRWKRNGLAS